MLDKEIFFHHARWMCRDEASMHESSVILSSSTPGKSVQERFFPYLKHKHFRILAFSLLLITLPLTVVIAGQRQELRQHASGARVERHPHPAAHGGGRAQVAAEHHAGFV